MNYAYILRCADGTLYTGWTNNLEKRLIAHRNGTGGKYTRSRLPVELVYSEEFDDKKDAQRREYAIKQMSRQEKERLVSGHNAAVFKTTKIAEVSFMIRAIDFKKENKDLYQPKTTPSIVDVPEFIFIAIGGKGDPNTSTEYAAAIEALYGLSYNIKMSNKSILEYVVPPLEGFWNVDDDTFRGGGAAITDKNKFEWTMLIRQPDFVTEEIFETAKAVLAKKKPNLDTSKARLIKITEGLCVGVMHIGSYDDEPATIIKMDKYAVDNGYSIDINESRRHHEIYLSDPRKTAPEKLKTVIRHPVKNKEQ